jgi:predicted nucleic acid-binding Zn ribbon protein
MPEYYYKTESNSCPSRGQESFKNCTGKFTIIKSMANASCEECCRLCGQKLVKDLQAMGPPGDILKGSGFYRNGG